VYHVLELIPLQSEERAPRTGPLSTRGAVKEESPVGPGESRSSGLWPTAARAPWVACRWCPVDYEVGQHLALMERQKERDHDAASHGETC
jgi:hypothetical protein